MLTNIKVTDATIALDDTGEGIPVLVLHGFPATRHLWSHVAPLLADAGFRVPSCVSPASDRPKTGPTTFNGNTTT
jgi:hypothetical protein